MRDGMLAGADRKLGKEDTEVLPLELKFFPPLHPDHVGESLYRLRMVRSH